MNKSFLALLGLGLVVSSAGCLPGNGNGDPWDLDPDHVDVPPPPSGDEPQPADVAPACTGTEVHVIGVYETSSDHDSQKHPIGDGLVRIERAGTHALVLSAYEPTRWKIELVAGARIKSIHLVGMHAQTVMPPHEDITITTDTSEQTLSGACGYSWPYNGEGCDTNRLIELAKNRTGLAVTSFHGCYHASSWTLGKDGSATSDCATTSGYQVDEFVNSCEPVLKPALPPAFRRVLSPTLTKR